MEFIKIILLFVFYAAVESKKCEIGPRGILCEYPNDISGAKCVEFKERLLTDGEKNFIVEEHNRLRHRIATGNETSLPKAYFMKKISWDEELAKAAQRWANQCGQPFKEKEREKYLVGANIAVSLQTGKNFDLPRLINKWKLGLPEINEVLVKKFHPQEREDIENFAQIIWADTDKIGCGISQYKGQCRERVHSICPLIELVCFYSPPGNIKDLPIYQTSDLDDLICVKETSDVLCNEILNRDNSGKTDSKYSKSSVNNAELESILERRYNDNIYKTTDYIKKLKREEPNEGQIAVTKCKKDNLVVGAKAGECVTAMANLVGKLRTCYGSNQPSQTDNQKMTAAETDCAKDQINPDTPQGGVAPTVTDEVKNKCIDAIDNLNKLFTTACKKHSTSSPGKPAASVNSTIIGGQILAACKLSKKDELNDCIAAAKAFRNIYNLCVGQKIDDKEGTVSKGIFETCEALVVADFPDDKITPAKKSNCDKAILKVDAEYKAKCQRGEGSYVKSSKPLILFILFFLSMYTHNKV